MITHSSRKKSLRDGFVSAVLNAPCEGMVVVERGRLFIRVDSESTVSHYGSGSYRLCLTSVLIEVSDLGHVRETLLGFTLKTVPQDTSYVYKSGC